MEDRGTNYVRYHGDSSFSPGGSFYDIIYCMKNYGIVPQEVMPGIMYGDTLPVHNELDAVAEVYINAIAKGKLKQIDSGLEKRSDAIYDTYLENVLKSSLTKEKNTHRRLSANHLV